MENMQPVITEKIAAALNASGTEAEVAEQIAFHLTDCSGDFEQILKLYHEPQSLSDDQVQTLVFKFLAHVPNHLAAAKKLAGLGPIEDVFGVGVLKEDED
jgi:hypothetical protein